MKIFFRYILPVTAILVLLGYLFTQQSSKIQTVNEPTASSDGTSELVAFYSALSNGNYEHASQYVQENCSDGRCFVENKSKEEIVEHLESMCKTQVCQKIEIDSAGAQDNADVYVHTVAFLDKEGSRARLCITEDCRIQKVTFAYRVSKTDGKWFMVDAPPTKF